MEEHVERGNEVEAKLLQSRWGLEHLLNVGRAVPVILVQVGGEGGVPNFLEGPEVGQERGQVTWQHQLYAVQRPQDFLDIVTLWKNDLIIILSLFILLHT